MSMFARIVLSVVLAAGAAGADELVGERPDGGALLANRQVVRPVGEQVVFQGRPIDVVWSPDGAQVYAKDNRGLVVIHAADWTIAQELPMDEKFGGSMHGIAVTADGAKLYLTSAQNRLFVAERNAEGAWGWTQRIALPGPGGGDAASHACGIALSADEQTAYVCLSRNNALGVVDLAQGELVKTIDTGVAPWDVVLSPDGGTAYVSNWGGRKPHADDQTAPSSGTPVVVDDRGVAASGTIGVVDLAAGTMKDEIAVGLHPCDLVLTADGARLYVANANSDTVSAIDTATRTVAKEWGIRPDENLPFGSLPDALALDEDAGVLYVANAGNNAIAVLDIEESAVAGLIPTGWYPGALALRGGHLVVANVKGLGSRTQAEAREGRHVKWFAGTVNHVEIPGAETLAAYTAQARDDARVPASLRAWEQEEARKEQQPVPVPARRGEPSVFNHVVYILKENRTYDQVFGDMKKGNSERRLCIYPRRLTPNHHALADEFVLLDNYYCNGVVSADGHSWATEGFVTDHLEKSFGGFTRSYTFGDDPLTYSASGFIWDRVLAAGLSFRNFGEMDDVSLVPDTATFTDVYNDYVNGTRTVQFVHHIGIDNLRRHSHPDYPGWNMKIPDVLRAEIFLKEFENYKKNGDFPNFVIIHLPQDHTSGTSEGMPTPRAHMADNDLALGRIVEAISHSDYWKDTLIIANEDDPQDGFDHVDGHRSLCLVASAYTKRGEVVSEFYNQTSVLHTFARVFGLQPLNQHDAQSNLMTACFNDTPDLTPYDAKTSDVKLDELNRKISELEGAEKHWALESAKLDFDGVDEANEGVLNRVLWHAAMGWDAPYPEAFEGAHGKGLKGLKLALDETQEDEDDD
ncbi:MAG: phosphoesterase [Candidatus Hydrogenedens sp.]|nr:phosphoesterase [Candidatus Hydrogenedens sp.]